MILTTAGNLVFQGRLDGAFVAYRADTGEEVWSTDLGLGVSAPPITYAVDGRQYVALLVGWGSVIIDTYPLVAGQFCVASEGFDPGREGTTDLVGVALGYRPEGGDFEVGIAEGGGSHDGFDCVLRIA